MHKIIYCFITLAALAAFNVSGQSFRIDSISESHYKIIIHKVPSYEYRWGFYHQQDISKTHGKFMECNVYYTGDSMTTINYKDSFGTFWVCLEATNYSGDKDTVCKSVRNILKKYVPPKTITNVFVPGKDSTGKDKVFAISNIQFRDYHLTIFDRWGQKVFESNDPKKGWNGKAMNPAMNCPDGTYFYILKYTLAEKPEESQTLNGTVTLIR